MIAVVMVLIACAYVVGRNDGLNGGDSTLLGASAMAANSQSSAKSSRGEALGGQAKDNTTLGRKSAAIVDGQ